LLKTCTYAPGLRFMRGDQLVSPKGYVQRGVSFEVAYQWGEKMSGRVWVRWLLVLTLTLTAPTGGSYALAQGSPPASSRSEETAIRPQGAMGAILGGLTGAIGAALTYTIDAAWDGGRHASARDFAAAVIKGALGGAAWGLILPEP